MTVSLALCAVLTLGAAGPVEPSDLEVTGRTRRAGIEEVTVALPADGTALREEQIEQLYRSLEAELAAGTRLVVLAQRPGGPARPIESFLAPITPPPPKIAQPTRPPGQGRAAAGEGFLAGKTVFLSPGHGWFHDPTDQRWETQRPVTNSIVEDFHTADVVTGHLVQRLENAGARVWVVRERDRQTALRIVDETDSDPTTGTCAESGDPARFIDSTFAGFGHVPLPYDATTNPLAQGAARLLSTTTGPADASVTWTPNLPAAGEYAVYVSFGSFANRPVDVHYQVRHAGGTTDVHVDQTIDGFTWRFLGKFPFDAGFRPGEQHVLLTNDTGDSNASWISFDAVRFGGGMGDIDAGGGAGGGASGRMRQEECARVYTQFLGAPPSVYSYYSTDRSSDIVARPRYAAWENEPGEDSIYLSWHTNAPDPATGTSSYIYSTNPTAGSAALQSAVHAELIADLRAGYDPNWVDRGLKSAPFGEVNPAHNSEMPAVLLEVAFHATASDALKLRDGRCLEVMTRGVTQGIARYFAARDGVQVELAPEPPVDLHVRVRASGEVDLSWSAPPAGPPGLYGDAPQSYRLFASSTARAFGDPLAEVSGTHSRLSNLDLTRPLFLRIVSVNAGGVSNPSTTLVVMDRAGGRGSGGGATAAGITALFVQGYTRRGPYLLAPTVEQVAGSTPVTAGGNGTLAVRRRWEEEVNTFDYAVEHAQALMGVGGVRLDSAERTAVSSGAVDLAGYDLILWAAGRQAEVFTSDPADDTSLNSAERAALEAYLAAGGRLFLSGAEVAYDLDRDADPNDDESLFMHNWLHAAYAADGAGTYGVLSAGAPPFGLLSPFQFDDGSGPSYDVAWPDVLSPWGSATGVLNYDTWGNAAVYYAAAHHVIYLGFPFESIETSAARDSLMRAAVRVLTRRR